MSLTNLHMRNALELMNMKYALTHIRILQEMCMFALGILKETVTASIQSLILPPAVIQQFGAMTPKEIVILSGRGLTVQELTLKIAKETVAQ
ncbi:MAG: hypothetical protein ACXW0G_00890 [Methylosarcina sp.]